MTLQHVGRGGQIVVCLACLRGEHAGCQDDRPGDYGMVCHCRVCFPAPCVTCFPPPPDGQSRNGDLCPNCSIQMPVSNCCDYCS